jgi:hypothetical protein
MREIPSVYSSSSRTIWLFRDKLADLDAVVLPFLVENDGVADMVEAKVFTSDVNLRLQVYSRTSNSRSVNKWFTGLKTTGYL